MYDNIHSAADSDFERTRRELEEMVRIPSVSASDFDPSEVRRSADFVAKLMTDSGLENVQLLVHKVRNDLLFVVALDQMSQPPDSRRGEPVGVD